MIDRMETENNISDMSDTNDIIGISNTSDTSNTSDSDSAAFDRPLTLTAGQPLSSPDNSGDELGAHSFLYSEIKVTDDDYSKLENIPEMSDGELQVFPPYLQTALSDDQAVLMRNLKGLKNYSYALWIPSNELRDDKDTTLPIPPGGLVNLCVLSYTLPVMILTVVRPGSDMDKMKLYNTKLARCRESAVTKINTNFSVAHGVILADMDQEDFNSTIERFQHTARLLSFRNSLQMTRAKCITVFRCIYKTRQVTEQRNTALEEAVVSAAHSTDSGEVTAPPDRKRPHSPSPETSTKHPRLEVDTSTKHPRLEVDTFTKHPRLEVDTFTKHPRLEVDTFTKHPRLELTSLMEQSNISEQEHKELERENESTLQESKSTHLEKEAMKKEMETSNREKQTLQEENTRLELQCESANKEKVSLEEENASILKEKRITKGEIESIRKMYESVMKHNESLQRKNEKMRADNSVSVNEFENREAVLQEDEFESLTKKYESVNEELQMTREGNATSVKEKEALQKQTETLERECDLLRKENEAVKAENELTTNEKETCEKEYEAMKKEHDSMKKQKQELVKRNSSSTMEIESTLKENESLKQEIDLMKQTIHDLKKDKDLTERQNLKIRKENRSFMKESACLKEENISLTKKNELLEKEKGATIKRIFVLKRDMGSLKRDKETMKKEKRVERKEKRSMKAEIDSLRSEYDSKAKEYDSIKTECDSININNDSMKAEIDRVKTRYEKICEENLKMTATIENLKKEKMEIRKRFQGEKETLQKEHVRDARLSLLVGTYSASVSTSPPASPGVEEMGDLPRYPKGQAREVTGARKRQTTSRGRTDKEKEIIQQNRAELVIQAAGMGNVEAVENALNEKMVDVNCRGRKGRTPLLTAAVNGEKDVFDCLVKHGADAKLVDDNDQNVLHLASLAGHLEMVKHIVSLKLIDKDSKGFFGRTALMAAARNGHVDVFRYLDKIGCDKTVLDDGKDNILHIASASENLDMVKHIISLNIADKESKGRGGETAWMRATKRGLKMIADYLVSIGCSGTFI